MSSEAWIKRVAFVVVAGLITAACGSTVPSTQQEAAEEAAAEGLSVPGGGAGGGGLGGGGDLGGGSLSGGTTGSGGAAPGGVAAGGTAGGSSGGFGSSGTGGSTGGGTDSAAQGVTASTIELGMLVAEDISAGNRALSGGNAATGIDMRRAWEAITEYVNKGGGMVGHKIKPVFHHYSATGEKSTEQNAQEACANFTEDNKVFAALGATIETETYYACIERGGAALVNGQSIRIFFDDRLFPRYPHMILPFGADLNTQSKTLVNALVKQNYFSKGAKIGLLTFDDPGFVYATERTLIPELRRHGLKPTDWVRVSRPAQYGDYGRFSSEVGNAVVKFKSEGITHAMMLDIGANLAFFFMQQAEKQQYRPRYGLTSQSGGSALADLLGEDARSQLKGARGIGWAPAIDLHAEDDNTRNERAKRCLKIMRDSGVEMSSRNAEAIAIGTCDTMWFLQAALEAGGRTITLDSYLAGIDRLGRSYVSAGIPFGVNVSGSRHDGLGAVANVSFFGECKCFRYTSKPYSIPN